MERMTDPTSRALTLLGLLESRPVWAGPELAQRLGVTERTVRRDIDRLRGLGYRVHADSGAGGGYSLGRGQVLPPLLLDEDEAVAVTVALASAALAGGGHAEPALRAMSKLDALMPGPLRHRLSALRTAAPDPLGGGPVLDAAVLLPCADAVRRSVRLTFDYRDRHGVVSARRVEPHRLATRRRRWWLLAYDLDRQDWRTFRLDRMSDPVAGEWRFVPRADVQDAAARLDRPPPPQAWRHRVQVRIAAPLAQVVAGMPALADSLVGLGSEATEFVTGADDPASAAGWLARLPWDFEVVADEAVRAAVVRLGVQLGSAGGELRGP